MEVEGKAVENPKWEAKQEQPVCNSKAEIVDSETIKFTWDATGDANPKAKLPKEKKWGYGQ